MGRSVFVTGGTGSVGQALVSRFVAEGYEVTFQYRASSTAAQSLRDKTGATAVQLDFAESFELPDREFDIVINNAGINITNVLSHQVSDADWETTLRVNLSVPFMTIRRYVPGMVRAGWGRIVNVSSIYGLRGTENNLPYNVSKHALSGLTKTVAREYGEFGITCNEICPGPIASDLMNRVARNKSVNEDLSPDEYLRAIAEEIPIGRMANPDEVAALAAFLVSSSAEYVNGTSVPLDGGLIA